MAQVPSISSNRTKAFFAEELTPKVLPVTPEWFELEPNSYADFGADISTTPREPISDDRQRKKGPVTDLDATAGFQMDLTQENFPLLAQGFMQATIRDKDELAIATVNTGGATDDFEPASGGDSYFAGDLLFAQGFDDAPNNGLHEVAGTPTATEIISTTTLTENTGQTGLIRKVGHIYASGDVSIDDSGFWPTIDTAAGDFTELGLVGPGEWLFIGGDTGVTQFATAANNTWVRVRSITALSMELDKASATMVTDAGAAKTIQIFFASRVVKNESDPTLIVQRSYNVERQLGAPDDALPAEIQSEYVTGATPGEMTLNVDTADKVTVDVGFVGMDYETRTGATGIKTGNRNAVTEADAFNTSSSFNRLRMYVWVDGDEFPSDLFTFIQDLAVSVNNNLDPNKAVNVLGAFAVNAGKFMVEGTANAYFNNVAQQAAVRANNDATLDFVMSQSNQAINIDLPLISLSDGQNTVESDAPILTPVAINAFDSAKINANMSHTFWMGFWDFVPNAAQN